MKIKGTVLVSERNKGLLTAIMLYLRKRFSHVITETEPEKIVELAKADSVDVIVLDAGQNTVSDQEYCLGLIKKIVALGQNIQIITLTNFGQNSFAMECIEAGAFDFLTKPWNNEKLLITVKNAYKLRLYSNILKEVGMLRESGDVGNAADADKELEKEILEKEYKKTVGKRVVTLEQMEVKMMQAALKRNRGNVSVAAAELGITRQTFYNKGKKYNLFE